MTLVVLNLLHFLGKVEDLQGISLVTFHDPVSELFSESGNEHLGLYEHLGGDHSELDGFRDAGLLDIGQARDGGLLQMRGEVSHVLWGSLLHLAEDAGDLGPVDPDGFLRLLEEVSEVGPNGLGRELCLAVPQERVLNVDSLGEVYAKEVLETGVPLLGIISEETGELINFTLVGGPLSNPGSFIETIDAVPGFEVVLVLLAVEKRQGVGPLDAFVLVQCVELVLVGGQVGGCGVR